MHPIQMCKLELLQVHRKVTDGVLGTVPFWLSKPLIMSRQIPSRTGRSSNYVLQNLLNSNLDTHTRSRAEFNMHAKHAKQNAILKKSVALVPRMKPETTKTAHPPIYW